MSLSVPICKVAERIPRGQFVLPAQSMGGVTGPLPTQPGLSEVTVIHSWFSSSVFQHTLGGAGLEPQAPSSLEEAHRMQR